MWPSINVVLLKILLERETRKGEREEGGGGVVLLLFGGIKFLFFMQLNRYLQLLSLSPSCRSLSCWTMYASNFYSLSLSVASYLYLSLTLLLLLYVCHF